MFTLIQPIQISPSTINIKAYYLISIPFILLAVGGIIFKEYVSCFNYQRQNNAILVRYKLESPTF